jgi:excisionase family DNA binding protein
MNEPGDTSPLLAEALAAILKPIVTQAVSEALAGNAGEPKTLLTPDELADRLKVPLSWVYEQSRQGNIPTHRIGRYIRFNLLEVIESQKKRE